MRSHLQRMLVVAGLVVFAGLLAGCFGPGIPPDAAPDGYQFCFWNVENLFDDRDDGRTEGGDREFDSWFARDPSSLQLKLAHLSEALIEMNHGRGPDILAVAEVESLRAADLLRMALNDRLPDETLHYQHVLMKEVSAGRHIAPAILTRLSVRGDKTQLHGHRQRILEGHIVVNGCDLVVVASHWTSRLTDKEGKQRGHYGNEIFGMFNAMYRTNPGVDFLVCGDFNDPPDAPSVTRHLRASGDLEAVRNGYESRLFDLFANKDPARFGTHHYGSHWFIFDQIAVSPGLLDDHGWNCDPESVEVVNTLVRPGDKQRRPWRFGSERDRFPRGYSDHFPVTVRLKVL
jgi:endonuclease/exonuclease/phosphatase family metal-dependent hydrolase